MKQIHERSTSLLSCEDFYKGFWHVMLVLFWKFCRLNKLFLPWSSVRPQDPGGAARSRWTSWSHAAPGRLDGRPLLEDCHCCSGCSGCSIPATGRHCNLQGQFDAIRLELSNRRSFFSRQESPLWFSIHIFNNTQIRVTFSFFFLIL